MEYGTGREAETRLAPGTARTEPAAYAPGSGGSGRTGHTRRLTSETKQAFKTTEFWIYLTILVGLLIAGIVADADEGSEVDGFGANQVWLYAVILTFGYWSAEGWRSPAARIPTRISRRPAATRPRSATGSRPPLRCSRRDPIPRGPIRARPRAADARSLIEEPGRGKPCPALSRSRRATGPAPARSPARWPRARWRGRPLSRPIRRTRPPPAAPARGSQRHRRPASRPGPPSAVRRSR